MTIKISKKTGAHLQRKVIYLSGRPGFSLLLKIIEHECLHIIVNKIADKSASKRLDNFGIAYLIAYKPNGIGHPIKIKRDDATFI